MQGDEGAKWPNWELQGKAVSTVSLFSNGEDARAQRATRSRIRLMDWTWSGNRADRQSLCDVENGVKSIPFIPHPPLAGRRKPARRAKQTAGSGMCSRELNTQYVRPQVPV